jgi:hypothetical protein
MNSGVVAVARGQVVTRGQVAARATARAEVVGSQRGIAITEIDHIDEAISENLINEEFEVGKVTAGTMLFRIMSWHLLRIGDPIYQKTCGRSLSVT